jgi:hypothetical protein
MGFFTPGVGTKIGGERAVRDSDGFFLEQPPPRKNTVKARIPPHERRDFTDSPARVDRRVGLSVKERFSWWCLFG